MRPHRYIPKNDVFINSKMAGKLLEVSQYTLRTYVADGVLPRKGTQYRLSAIRRLQSNPLGEIFEDGK